jgi:predicted metalloprotease with PDZ domain
MTQATARDGLVETSTPAIEGFFNARIAEKKPGDLVYLTILRFADLSTLLIKLGGRREGTYRIVPLATQTEAQKRIYRSWLGQ